MIWIILLLIGLSFAWAISVSTRRLRSVQARRGVRRGDSGGLDGGSGSSGEWHSNAGHGACGDGGGDSDSGGDCGGGGDGGGGGGD